MKNHPGSYFFRKRVFGWVPHRAMVLFTCRSYLPVKKGNFLIISAGGRSTEELSDSKKEKMLRRIEKLIDKWVTGIMEANRRNYYGKCAAYIAAVGEVKESWRETGEKQGFRWSNV